GMGSVGAMARGSADRYFQQDIKDTLKLVPEGVEGQVPYKGAAATVLHQLSGGLRAAMGYVGAKTLKELHEKAEFVRVSGAGTRESSAAGLPPRGGRPNSPPGGVSFPLGGGKPGPPEKTPWPRGGRRGRTPGAPAPPRVGAPPLRGRAPPPGDPPP